jgi:hypothetical protein
VSLTEIVIADNLSAYQNPPVADFLALHPKFHLHFASTAASRLSQVEQWSGKVESRHHRPRRIHVGV